MSMKELPSTVTEELLYPDSTLFRSGNRLPTPEEVRSGLPLGYHTEPHISAKLTFPLLNLFVKFGPSVRRSEAESLRFVREKLGDRVPVPEVYGWYWNVGDGFLFMELIDGITLEERWAGLSEEEKDEVCGELGGMVRSLGTLEQDAEDRFIGTVSNLPLTDNVFVDLWKGYTPGPFASVPSFHDWLSSLNLPRGTMSHYRDLLPDTHSIKFAHADLHRANILVPRTGRPIIRAVVDWGQAGWYPDYWDYCKARYVAVPGDEWEKQCIPRIWGRELEEWYWSWSQCLERIGR